MRNEAVGGWKVLEEEAQAALELGRHEMGVVDDRNEQFVEAVDFEGLFV